jgi:tripeptidyl-peptidase-2
MAAASLDLPDFPLSSSRVPDAETQAKTFLTKHPDYDGRGMVIAVMDTGCDPGAPGLQKTSTGLPKIIDCVDCTGSGDVDTTTTAKLDSEGFLLNPHTGRKLKMGTGPRWANPSGTWRLGYKAKFELVDSGLVERLKKERKAASDEVHLGYAAEARKRLLDFEKENPKPLKDEALKLQLKDLEDRVAQLAAAQSSSEDEGPLLDVVAWHDGTHWRAAVSLSEDGDLTSTPALTNFATEHEWSHLGEASQMNYCVNIYDEGTIVSIVCDMSSHGTHVAGIAAACYPEKPDMNGVAPGAQVVSLKIGDTRLDGMETGTGLARAFAHCVKANVDLINLSFGEPSSPAGSGRLIELIKKVVVQHGIIFVTSAGNSGPALSTIGSPGDGSDTFITVGAHVSAPAMEAQYSMLEKVPATPYTWTSRGPCQDGSLGVAICAPGSAITCLPNWTLTGAQLYNGTSMASPNACGCLALVLSGLRAQSISWSAASVRRAACASALALPTADPFAVGTGMIQVDACYEYLLANSALPYADVTFATSVVDRGRGIYLREPAETATPQVFNVKVDPQFKELDPSLNRAKIDFDVNLALTSTAPWVKVPQFAVLPAAGKTIAVSVDPTGLQEGEAHLAHVIGYDTGKSGAGPLFRVPITVLRPVAPTVCPLAQEAPRFVRKSLGLSAGTLVRSFVAVPKGSTWAEFKLRTKAFTGGNRLLTMYVLQDTPHLSYGKGSEEFVFRFTAGGEQTKTFRVEAGGSIEVCVGQYWNSLGATEADLEVAFHGVSAEASVVPLSTGNPVTSVYAVSGPGAVMMKPSASLTVHRTTLRPTSSSLKPGGERDVYLEGKRVYELILEYSFKLDEDAEVTPQALLFNDKLYESAFESQLVLVHDHGKRCVACVDCWPEAAKLKKGEYVARLQVRHDDVSMLEKLKGYPLCVDRQLEKAITVKAYSDYGGAVAGKGDFTAQKVKGGIRKAMHFAMPVDEKLPDSVKAGDMLLGPVSLGEPAMKAAGKKSRGGSMMHFSVMAPKHEDKKEEEKEEEDLKAKIEKLEEAVKVEKLTQLRKWESKGDYETLLSELLAAQPKHLAWHQEQIKGAEELKSADEAEAKAAESSRLQKCAEAVDKLLEAVDQEAISAHLGRRIDKEDKAAVKKGKELDKAKDALVEALTKKVTALATLAADDESKKAALTASYKALTSWVDTSEAKHAKAVAAHEKAFGRFGSALAAWNKHIGNEGKPGKDLFEERARLYEALGWTAWAAKERKSLYYKYPKSYPPF